MDAPEPSAASTASRERPRMSGIRRELRAATTHSCKEHRGPSSDPDRRHPPTDGTSKGPGRAPNAVAPHAS